MPAKVMLVPGMKPRGLSTKLVEVVDGPIAALGLHRGGIVEACLRCPRPADHAPQVRTDRLRPPLLKVWQACAFLRRVLAPPGVGVGEQLLDRLRHFRFRGFAGRRLLRHGDVVAGLGRLGRCEDRAGRDVDRKHAKERAQDRAMILLTSKESIAGKARAAFSRNKQAAADCGGAQIAGLPRCWQPV